MTAAPKATKSKPEAAAKPKPAVAKVAKKAKVAKAKPSHPTYKVMISKAISELKERNGSSRQAIQKYIQSTFKTAEGSGVHLKLALKRSVAAGHLIQVKGTGASGSFKLKNDTKKKVASPKPAAKKKPSAAKKSVKAKKAEGDKKPAAKKTKKAAPKKAKAPAKKVKSAKAKKVTKK